MKKYLLFTLGAMLLTTLAQAKNLPELSNAIEREIAKQTLPFANKRVQQMCKEWPTCEEWVENKIQQNPSFKVVDTEVERRLSKWDKDKAIWQYTFYAQTQEKGQTKAYKFSSDDQGISYAAPVLIKKFPGHPGKPTEHISFLKSVPNQNSYAYYLYLCNSWPGYEQWKRNRNGFSPCKVLISQYIYRWNAQGNALWKKRLWVEGSSSAFECTKVFYFQAYQTQPGGDFTYQSPVKTVKFPDHDNF